MKFYWDSSALIRALEEPNIHASLRSGQNFTRPHTLAEVFSTLTKGVRFRYSPEDATVLAEDMARHLEFVELTTHDTLNALKKAQAQGVRGARIHDLMHAEAAIKCGADTLLTVDSAGFSSLSLPLSITYPH
jgi:predicted nucleic acid-binding protein